MSRSLNLISVAGVIFGLASSLMLCEWMSAAWFGVAS
jgi:hypothetical protein